MKLHKLTNGSGEVYAFEIGSFPLRRGSVAYFIAKMKDVKINKGPVHFSRWDEDIFCTFEMDGAVFEVKQSPDKRRRYRIGPADEQRHEDIDLLIERFAGATKLSLFLNGALYGYLKANVSD